MEKTSIKYMELLGHVEVNLKYKGWHNGFYLLNKLVADSEINSNCKFLFERWLESKSTLDLREATESSRTLFDRELDFVNAVDSLDSCII